MLFFYVAYHNRVPFSVLCENSDVICDLVLFFISSHINLVVKPEPDKAVKILLIVKSWVTLQFTSQFLALTKH